MRERATRARGISVVIATTALFLGSLAVVHLIAGTAQASAQAGDSLKEGREIFLTYCASCHGRSGEGNGPVAASMRRTPPDITGLALANGGLFPKARVGRIIEGRDVEAHGDREMPVWGNAFRFTPGGQSEAAVHARILVVIHYLESIQRRRG